MPVLGFAVGYGVCYLHEEGLLRSKWNVEYVDYVQLITVNEMKFTMHVHTECSTDFTNKYNLT